MNVHPHDRYHLPADFAARLDRACASAGLSLYSLAASAGVSKSMLVRTRAGKLASIHGSDLIRISLRLRVDPSELLGR